MCTDKSVSKPISWGIFLDTSCNKISSVASKISVWPKSCLPFKYKERFSTKPKWFKMNNYKLFLLYQTEYKIYVNSGNFKETYN